MIIEFQEMKMWYRCHIRRVTRVLAWDWPWAVSVADFHIWTWTMNDGHVPCSTVQHCLHTLFTVWCNRSNRHTKKILWQMMIENHWQPLIPSTNPPHKNLKVSLLTCSSNSCISTLTKTSGSEAAAVWTLNASLLSPIWYVHPVSIGWAQGSLLPST